MLCTFLAFPAAALIVSAVGWRLARSRPETFSVARYAGLSTIAAVLVLLWGLSWNPPKESPDTTLLTGMGPYSIAHFSATVTGALSIVACFFLLAAAGIDWLIVKQTSRMESPL